MASSRGRLAPWAMAFAVMASPSAVTADPYTIDDWLKAESFGAVSLSPDGRRIVFEQRGPYETASRFDLGHLGLSLTSRLWISGGARAAPEPLLPVEEGPGLVPGPWSPSGDRIVVHRLRDDQWRSGVVNASSRAVRWFDVGAEPATRGETVIWRDDRTVLMIVRADGGMPYDFAGLADGMSGSASRWRAARDGKEASALVWGSGRRAPMQAYGAATHLLRLDVETGEATRVMEGRALDMALAPDRRWLAVLDRGPPYAVDQNRPFLASEIPEERRLTLINLDSGEIWTPCAGCDIAQGLLNWSADGRLLVWKRDRSAGPVDGALLVVDPVRGVSEAVTLGGLEPEAGATRDTSFETVRADWFDGAPVVLARRPGDTRADWYRLDDAGPRVLTSGLASPPGRIESIGRDALLVLAGGAAFEVDAEGGTRRLGRRSDLSSVSASTIWDPPRRRLNTRARRDALIVRSAAGGLLTLDAGSDRETVLATDPGTLLAVSEQGGVDVANLRGVQSLRRFEVGAPVQTLSTINGSLAEVSFAEALPVTHPGPDGEVLTGWLYRPPPGAPNLGRPLPLVVIAYPKKTVRPSGDPTQDGVMIHPQFYASMGYAVFTPHLPRRDYPLAASDGLTAQILTAVDALIARNPDIDGDRMVFAGHSFGGYTGLMAATQTDRFKSFVILDGNAEMASSWGQFSVMGATNTEFGMTARRNAGWVERGQGALGAPPWAAAQLYQRHSPLYAADRITAPVLLIHGDRDFIGVGQAESMFTALWRQDKTAELVVYGGEVHSIASPANLRDLYRRIEDWLAWTLREPSAPVPPVAVPLLTAPLALPSDAPKPPGRRPPGSP